MRHPGAIAAVVGFASFVLAHLGQRILGHFRVAPVGDKGRHAADGMGAMFVTGAHQQLGVGTHKGRRHRHLGAVGQDHARCVAQIF